jgi:flagellar basal body-associated protein FliL
MKRIELEEDGPCSFKCILVMIMVTLIVQVFLMTLPVGVGVMVYGRHHEKFEAAGKLDAKAIVTNVNHIGDFPMEDLVGASKRAAVDGLKLLKRLEELSIKVDNNTDIFGDVKRVLHAALGPLDGANKLLSPKMRGTFILIVEKVLRILDKMTDDEIHRLVESAAKASEAASHMLTDNNINRTMHIMDDADYTMMKFDKMLSKFVN